MNSDASECRHPKSQFSGSKVIVSGQKMGTSLSSRHGHSFVQKHILGSQKRLLICSKKHILGGQKWVHFGVQKWAHFWVHKWAPNLKLVRRGTFLDPKMGPFLDPKMDPFLPPKKSFFQNRPHFWSVRSTCVWDPNICFLQTRAHFWDRRNVLTLSKNPFLETEGVHIFWVQNLHKM